MKPGRIVLIVFGLTVLSLFSSYIKKILDYIFGRRCIIYNNYEICVKSGKFEDNKKMLFKTLGVYLNKLFYRLKTLESSNKNVKRLLKRIGEKGITKLEEINASYDSEYTGNTGRTLKMCLGKKEYIEEKEDIIDINTLVFVALHELAHTMTVEKGHTKEFIDNWKFLLNQAVAINIYKPVNYKNNIQSYCGTRLTNNPLLN